ncbi:hypothetical protein RCO48_39530 [Peribacillus frigoritolerans]|nr:hypothetical protein [Peribacillus frigoritolerans]
MSTQLSHEKLTLLKRQAAEARSLIIKNSSPRRSGACGRPNVSGRLAGKPLF